MSRLIPQLRPPGVIPYKQSAFSCEPIHDPVGSPFFEVGLLPTKWVDMDKFLKFEGDAPINLSISSMGVRPTSLYSSGGA
jgi:hypothetical protein